MIAKRETSQRLLQELCDNAKAKVLQLQARRCIAAHISVLVWHW